MAPDQLSVNYACDPAGNLTGITDYKGQVTGRAYDKRNRLLTVTAPDGGVTGYTYNGADQWLTVTYPNGVKAEATYDPGNRLTKLVHRKPDLTVIASFEYTYDALGQWTSVVDNAGTTQYAYDANNRLGMVTEPDGSTIQFTYDGAGNRLTKVVAPPGGATRTTSYAYDAVDRLTQVTDPDGTTAAYTFDANGNLTGDGTRTYTYDGLNRLVSVKQGTETLATCSYNGDSLRTEKVAGGVTTRYYYDGDRVLNEGDGTAVTASHVWGLSLIRRDKGGQTGYYLHNGHSDVVGVVDPSAAMLATYRYDAFGVPTEATGTFDNPFRYTTEPYDGETGAIYLRSRYYQPALGRFMTQDTWPGDPLLPWTRNQYVYVGNNPVNYVDPTGHYMETFLDAAGLAWSVHDFIEDPSWANFGWILLDVGGIVLPVITGAGVIDMQMILPSLVVRRGLSLPMRLGHGGRLPTGPKPPGMNSALFAILNELFGSVDAYWPECPPDTDAPFLISEKRLRKGRSCILLRTPFALAC